MGIIYDHAAKDSCKFLFLYNHYLELATTVQCRFIRLICCNSGIVCMYSEDNVVHC